MTTLPDASIVKSFSLLPPPSPKVPEPLTLTSPDAVLPETNSMTTPALPVLVNLDFVPLPLTSNNCAGLVVPIPILPPSE